MFLRDIQAKSGMVGNYTINRGHVDNVPKLNTVGNQLHLLITIIILLLTLAQCTGGLLLSVSSGLCVSLCA